MGVISKVIAIRSLAMCVSSLAISVSITSAAIASDLKDITDADSGEIIVTAQKREQSIQDVGISISVLNSRALEANGVVNVQEIGALIPNVQVNFATDIVSFNIRGVGQSEFATNFDPPVAVNVDEVYLSKVFMTGLLLFDIDRVETLKGPQGTLFGRNATGGAVNFYTRKPTETLQFGGNIGYDNYQTVRSEAYLSGPLAENLSARVAGMYVHQNKGFYRNLTLGTRDGSERRFALRGQLLWDNGTTSANLTGTYGEDTSIYAPYEGVGVLTPESLAAGAPAFCPAYLAGTATGGDPNCVRAFDGLNPGDDDPFTSTNNLRHKADSKGSGIIFRVEHDMGWAALTSISSYQHFRRVYQGDTDGTPSSTLGEYWRAKIDQYSQEIRLTGSTGPWNYVLGGYYEHDSLKSGDFLAVAGGTAPGFFTPTSQKVDAAALFFHNEVGVTDTLKLIAGLRFTKEKVSIDSITYAFTGVSSNRRPSPQNLLAVLASSDDLPGGNSQTNNAATYKVGIEWQPQLGSNLVDKLMVYGHVSTGFRTGGYNSEFAATQSAFTELKAENLTAYEAGVKSMLWDRRVTANLSVFHYDFTDGFINVDSPTSPVPLTINAANISSYGAEFELGIRPFSGLSINNTFGWLDSKITSEISSAGVSLKNNSTINSPRWSYAVNGSYTAAVTDEYQLTVSANANWRSSQYLEANNSPNSREGGYWVAGARASIGPSDERWSLAAWVKNLTNTHYRTYVNDLPDFGFLLNVYGLPRTYGSTFTVKF